jgi:hypothetical protein
MRRERRQPTRREWVYPQRAGQVTRGARERWQHEHPAGDHVGFASLHRTSVDFNERGSLCRELGLWVAAACLVLDDILPGVYVGRSLKLLGVVAKRQRRHLTQADWVGEGVSFFSSRLRRSAPDCFCQPPVRALAVEREARIRKIEGVEILDIHEGASVVHVSGSRGQGVQDSSFPGGYGVVFVQILAGQPTTQRVSQLHAKRPISEQNSNWGRGKPFWLDAPL